MSRKFIRKSRKFSDGSFRRFVRKSEIDSNKSFKEPIGKPEKFLKEFTEKSEKYSNAGFNFENITNNQICYLPYANDEITEKNTKESNGKSETFLKEPVEKCGRFSNTGFNFKNITNDKISYFLYIDDEMIEDYPMDSPKHPPIIINSEEMAYHLEKIIFQIKLLRQRRGPFIFKAFEDWSSLDDESACIYDNWYRFRAYQYMKYERYEKNIK